MCGAVMHIIARLSEIIIISMLIGGVMGRGRDGSMDKWHVLIISHAPGVGYPV